MKSVKGYFNNLCKKKQYLNIFSRIFSAECHMCTQCACAVYACVHGVVYRETNDTEKKIQTRIRNVCEVCVCVCQHPHVECIVFMEIELWYGGESQNYVKHEFNLKGWLRVCHLPVQGVPKYWIRKKRFFVVISIDLLQTGMWLYFVC